MHEMLLVIAAMIVVIPVCVFWRPFLGLPFGPCYAARQKAEAEKLICEYLDTTNECIYPSEIAERLHIDYDLCFEIIEEPLEEGEVAYEKE